MTHVLIRPRTIYAWSGPSLLIVDTHGECSDSAGLTGFYHREARCLSTCRLQIDGSRPWLCEAAAVAPDELTFSFTYPEIAAYGGGGTGQSGDEEPHNGAGIAQRALDIHVGYRVRFNALAMAIAITNHSRAPVSFELALLVGADFADIQEAQAGRRTQNADVRAVRRPGRLEYEYGHDTIPYRTVVHHPGEWNAEDGRLVSRWNLQPAEQQRADVTVEAIAFERIDREALAERDAHLAAWRDAFTRIEAPGNRLFEHVLSRNIRDFASFALLEGAKDEWLAPQAGVPLYPALFGRDAITAGWQAGSLDQGASLDATLTRLGRLQTNRDSAWRDEEPGRIPYQVRTGPLAILNTNPYAAYYADCASPLMYVISLANLFAWTGQEECLRRHWDTARRILDWARDRGDRDGDGYIEYVTRSPDGAKNQGWKDSGDAVVYDDGTQVPAPIATCELQGYWYAAQQLFGALCWMRGFGAESKAWLASAADLKQRFNRDWWVERESCFAFAMDPGKRLIESPTSNVGHCITSGIVDADHLPGTVGRLFAPDMFSGWGIRTLSSNHPYYNPVSYHRGTVWAVEQATILFGLRRFGFDARVHDLATALYELALLYPEFRVPECVGGYSRAERPAPGAYPQANTPQLWNASAFPLMVQTLLGLLPIAPHDLLVLDPALPPWLPEVAVHDLRVGGARVSLRCWRDRDGASHFDVLQKHGTLRIVRQPPPESLHAGARERFGALLETVLH